jgi:hypothetical protein
VITCASSFQRCGSLFHTPIGTAFADLLIDGHRETWPLRGKQFRNWLRKRYFEETGCAANAGVLQSAIDLLEARAQFDAGERSINVRVGAHESSIYLDMSDKGWHAAEIRADGWRIIGAPPIRFRRMPAMLALPFPERHGCIDQLRPFLNLRSHDDFVLVVAWLLAALRPNGPYPVLVIAGEQGSAKTALTRLLRALIDPNAAPTRALSREERELMISANNSHVIAFDNLSGLPPWLSDALCRLASGASFAVRRLYTDNEETLFQAARPIILNGIEDVITRPDLADRALFLNLPPVPDERRRPEDELWREFELVRPRILGALLDASSHGLKTIAFTRVRSLPRMADFVLWVSACEGALWPAGTFLRAYNMNRRVAVDDAIDVDPLAASIRALMAARRSWTGTASDLLRAAAGIGSGAPEGLASWPKNPHALAGRLRRSQPFLRTIRIEIVFSREGHAGSRIITLVSKADGLRRNCVSSVSGDVVKLG